MSIQKYVGRQPRVRRGLPRAYSNKLSYDELLNAESALGKTIFGPVPAGHHREFFESKKNVWIWHESYPGTSGENVDVTIRYEVHPNGVYKSKNGSDYKKITDDELNNFREAAAAYLNLIGTKLYC